MKKLFFLLLMLPMFTFGQGLFLHNENGTYSTGDSVSTDYHIQRFTLDFEGQALVFETMATKRMYVGEDTLTGSKRIRYGMTLNDTIYVGGNPYSTLQVFGAIFTSGDIDIIKIVNDALIEKYPEKKYVE